MRRDLQTYFGYHVTVEVRMMPCWYLKAKPDAALKLKTKTPGQKYSRVVRDEDIVEYRNAIPKDILFNLGHSMDSAC
jgi:hypothetical protein